MTRWLPSGVLGPLNGTKQLCDDSDPVRVYQNAIKTGKQIRIDISWKLCRNETWLLVWSGLTESMRTDPGLDITGTTPS